MKKLLLFIISLLVNIFFHKKDMNLPAQFTRELAMEYFVAYAKFENVYLDESIKINNEDKIRGDVGAAEFEYRDNEKLFIVRGLMSKDIATADPDFKKQILDRLSIINENPRKEFDGALFEFDTTAFELQKDYPERINLRMDFTKPVSKTEFVKRVDALMDQSFMFKQNEYSKIIDDIYNEYFPD